MTIRVLRMIEYTYDTAERMTEDMARWTIAGTFGPGPNGTMIMRSATVCISTPETPFIMVKPDD